MKVTFEAREREDGTMFVTCANLPMFSAVAKTGDWDLIFNLAAMYTKENGSFAVRPSKDEHA